MFVLCALPILFLLVGASGLLPFVQPSLVLLTAVYVFCINGLSPPRE